MAWHRVDQYQASLDLKSGRHFINLYKDQRGQGRVEDLLAVGRIETEDTLMFHAAIDLMRNEGPYVSWDDRTGILSVGVEPVGEEES
jgi:hypothetical protein